MKSEAHAVTNVGTIDYTFQVQKRTLPKLRQNLHYYSLRLLR